MESKVGRFGEMSRFLESSPLVAQGRATSYFFFMLCDSFSAALYPRREFSPAPILKRRKTAKIPVFDRKSLE
jgi:hypothetical protein